MTKIIEVVSPLTPDMINQLEAGDLVRISGVLYTGRDAAHKRMIEALAEGRELPFDLAGQTIYYTGPCPAKPGQVIGSCGPTTSGRVDCYTPVLLARGLKGMIGKGPRNEAVIEQMIASGAVYFAAIGGAGAAIARSVKKAEVVAYADLGPEAVYRLEVAGFPCIVTIDSKGRDLYKTGVEKYKITI